VPQSRRIYLLASLLVILAVNRSARVVGAADIQVQSPTLLAPPNDAQRAKAEKTIRDLYGGQIGAAKSPAAKRELAKKLFEQAIESKADPAGQFVLLEMARQLALSVDEPLVVLQSIEETARRFQIDAIPIRRDAFVKLAKAAMNPINSRLLADAAWSALDDAIVADKFEAADDLAEAGITFAKRTKESELNRQWLVRRQQLGEIETAYEAVRVSEQTLEKSPLDPAANLAVGKYTVFFKGNFDLGLPMIALAPASPLEALAATEMRPPDAAEPQLKLADGWWDLADSTTDAWQKQRLQARALLWYGVALPNLAGMPRNRVEKKILEATGRIFVRVQGLGRKRAVPSEFVPPTLPRGNRSTPFVDPPIGAELLIGLDIGMNAGGQYIRGIKPIFFTPRGIVEGSMHGEPGGEIFSVRAPAGYAIAGLTEKGTNRIEALSVMLMQIQGATLDPRTAYASPWYGNTASDIQIRILGSGVPIIGVAGRADFNSLINFALVPAK
jgi:hypothetical protein